MTDRIRKFLAIMIPCAAFQSRVDDPRLLGEPESLDTVACGEGSTPVACDLCSQRDRHSECHGTVDPAAAHLLHSSMTE